MKNTVRSFEADNERIPTRITFAATDDVRDAISSMIELYEGRPAPTLSALIRKAIVVGAKSIVSEEDS